MASEVLYGRNILTPYFDMRKFEDSIYNRPRVRAERIKKRKRIRVLDKLLIFAVFILAAILFYYVGAICLQQIKISGKETNIKKLQNTLILKEKENEVRIDAIKSEIKFDDLKMKAYMELNMITPTEKNIIYFDKTDNGFVRQYENIR